MRLTYPPGSIYTLDLACSLLCTLLSAVLNNEWHDATESTTWCTHNTNNKLITTSNSLKLLIKWSNTENTNTACDTHQQLHTAHSTACYRLNYVTSQCLPALLYERIFTYNCVNTHWQLDWCLQLVWLHTHSCTTTNTQRRQEEQCFP